MQEFTGSHYVTSNQHKDVSEGRQIRDGKDITSLHQYQININPFLADQSLRNISSDVTCDSTVYSDKAEKVGCKILKSMEGKDVEGYTLKKKGQVVTMDYNCSVKVDGEVVQVLFLNCYSNVSWQLQVVWLTPKLKYSNVNYAVNHQHYSNHQDS